MLTNIFTVEYDIRCFTNTLEKICTVCAMHFYLRLNRQFNSDIICFTVFLTIGFVMRNTSGVGWIPLLFIKVFRDGLFPYFLISAIVISLPMLSLTVYLDSLYYSTKADGEKFEWVLTLWNFL